MLMLIDCTQNSTPYPKHAVFDTHNITLYALIERWGGTSWAVRWVDSNNELSRVVTVDCRGFATVQDAFAHAEKTFNQENATP